MSGYLLSIAGIVLLSAILSVALPGVKTAKLIKGTAKLACLFVILAPVLRFFKEGAEGGEGNFPFFSGETVIETDGGFIDYCSTKRIESAEKALGEKLSEVFSFRAEVTLEWEYRGSLTGEDYQSAYEGREILITKAVVRDPDGVIGEEVKREVTEYVAEEYGCEAEFAG